MAAGAPVAMGVNGSLNVAVASADGEQGVAVSYSSFNERGHLINVAAGFSTGGGSAVRASISIPFNPSF